VIELRCRYHQKRKTIPARLRTNGDALTKM
jgi:hypothetical protein